MTDWRNEIVRSKRLVQSNESTIIFEYDHTYVKGNIGNNMDFLKFLLMIISLRSFTLVKEPISTTKELDTHIYLTLFSHYNIIHPYLMN